MLSSRQVSADHGALDDRLLTMVAEFLGQGLRAGEPAVVLATVPQSDAIVERLAENLIDVERLRRSGHLICVDADDQLAMVLLDGAPDPQSFTRHIGGIIESALCKGPATLVRVYSAMVDILWRRGQPDAALQLESLFYALAQTHAYSLLCAYAMGDFYKQLNRGAEGQRQKAIDLRITNREEDVLRQTALGKTNKEIANALDISVRTVEAHKANAMRKLGLAGRTDVVRFALSQGWLDHR